MFQRSIQWRTANKPVLLTFDDGPSGTSTTLVLDTLARHSIKAIFFVVGKQLEAPENKALVKRMVREGHIVGNHTYSHPKLAGLSRKKIYSEISRTQDAIVQCGAVARLFRSPFGVVDADIADIVRHMELWGLGWNADTGDWHRELDQRAWIQRGLQGVSCNRENIVLLHDTEIGTAENLDSFVMELIRQGHSFPRPFFEDGLQEDGEESAWLAVMPGWSTLPGLPLFRPNPRPASLERGNNTDAHLAQTDSVCMTHENWRSGLKAPLIMQTKEKWDSEYREHLWDSLRTAEEVPRYSVMLGFCLHTGRNRRVLDAGCGEAVFLDYLRPCGYEHYLGIDISEVAITNNHGKADHKTQFIAANIEEFTAAGQFDCVVFNECLYYLHDPISVMERYRHILAEDGIMVTSVFASNRCMTKLITQIKRRYSCLSQVTISNHRGKWVCNLFANATLRLPRRRSRIN